MTDSPSCRCCCTRRSGSIRQPGWPSTPMPSPRSTSGRSGPARLLGGAGRAPHLGQEVGRGARVGCAVREVVRRRNAQRRGELRRPARGRRQRRPGRVPLDRRAGGRHPRHHLPPAQGRGVQGRERADQPRGEEGRPGRDLHADDPGDRVRDARLRAPRRPAHGGVRRVFGGGAEDPDHRLRRADRDHRRRRLAQGRARRAEAGRGRGAEGVPGGAQRAGGEAHRAGGRLDRGP